MLTGVRKETFSEFYPLVLNGTNAFLQTIYLENNIETITEISSVNWPLTTGKWYHLNISIEDYHIIVSIDDAEVLNVTDTTTHNHPIGGFYLETSFERVYIDNLVVTKL